MGESQQLFPRRSTRFGTVMLRALLFAGLWWILAEGVTEAWLLGAVAVTVAVWTSLRLWPPAATPIRLAGLPGFLGFFVWNSIRGGLQVVGMAVRGRGALQPALVELAVKLPSGAACVLMVNTLSLMPGTLGVDLNGTTLRLHVLDERLPVIDEARSLEAVIAWLFGSSP